MQEPKSSCNSSIWKFRHFCAIYQLADSRRGTWSKSLYNRKLSIVVKTYSTLALRQLTSPLRFRRRFTIRSPHIRDIVCISKSILSYQISSLDLAQNSLHLETLNEKGLHCRISQKVYLEPKWLRYLIGVGAPTLTIPNHLFYLFNFNFNLSGGKRRSQNHKIIIRKENKSNCYIHMISSRYLSDSR